MPIELIDLASRINPKKTSLFLGAGASIPSGAPSGPDLAKILWRDVAQKPPQSDDFVETATHLCRADRRGVVEAIIATLNRLSPTGGLLAFPKFPWRAIYTTNFDRLIEKSYARSQTPLVPIRSNYDFSTKETDEGLRLFKLHGCISQDRSLGDKSSLTITERDYEDHKSYRQAMFSNFKNDLFNNDVLIIGQSLRDQHLYDVVKEAIAATEQGAPGKVYALIYNRGDLRAQGLEDRGAFIAYGGIDEFTDILAGDSSKYEAVALPSETSKNFALSAQLVSTSIDVSHAKTLSPNPTRMFNGAAATYADIAASNVFERSSLQTLKDRLKEKNAKFAVITGAAGVGKTTLARHLNLELNLSGYICWEHKADFPFRHQNWISLEQELRRHGLMGALLIDECTRHLRSVNQLADYLSDIEKPALQLILTANSAQWARRIKSRRLFTDSIVRELVQLEEMEVNGLINLVDRNSAIASLVQASFKSLSRAKQSEQLRRKCSADMYVCLKNIFATENLDTILLAEYDELEISLQEYYRYVAALEAIGTKVHRQLVIRILNMNADQVQSTLDGLRGIVDEFDIKPSDGIYGWSTRHIVIARKITEYKFSSSSELENLFDAVIDNINPSVPIELQSVRDLCDVEHGIGSLPDFGPRLRLYQRLIEIAPGERIPWHRYIRELLNEEDLEQVEFAIRDAKTAVGADAPIDRYSVRLLIARSKLLKGISGMDRKALLRKAYDLALRNSERHKYDKTSFYTLCECAIELINVGEDHTILDEALHRLRLAIETIADPDMNQKLRQYEAIRYRKH